MKEKFLTNLAKFYLIYGCEGTTCLVTDIFGEKKFEFFY